MTTTENSRADALTAQAALAAIATFEIVGENNDSREPNVADRFILTEFIAHAFGERSVDHPTAAITDKRAVLDEALSVFEKAACRETYRVREGVAAVLKFAASRATSITETVAVGADELAHEVWSAAQLAPGEGIEDGGQRIAAILSRSPAMNADDARRMRTLCRLLDAIDDEGNGFPGEVHEAFQHSGEQARAALDAVAIPEDYAGSPAMAAEAMEIPDESMFQRLFSKHGGPVDDEGWCINESGLRDFLHGLAAVPLPVQADAREELTTEQLRTVECADAWLTDKGLPTYTKLRALATRPDLSEPCSEVTDAWIKVDVQYPTEAGIAPDDDVTAWNSDPGFPTIVEARFVSPGFPEYTYWKKKPHGPIDVARTDDSAHDGR